MTPTRAARLFALELTIVGLMGMATGSLLYAAIQERLGSSGITGASWWAWQGSLDGLTVGLVATGSTIALWLISSQQMRRSLKVAPRMLPGPRHWSAAVGGACLAVGGGYLLQTAWHGWRSPTKQNLTDSSSALLMGMVVVSIVGVLLTGPMVLHVLAPWLARRVPHAAFALGLRSAGFRAPQVGRLTAFVLALVLVGGAATGFLYGLRNTAVGDPTAVQVSLNLDEIPPSDRAKLGELPDEPHAYLVEDLKRTEVYVGSCQGVMAVQHAADANAGSCAEDAIQRGEEIGPSEPGGPSSRDVTSVQFAPGQAPIAIPQIAAIPSAAWGIKLPARFEAQARQASNGLLFFRVSKEDGSYDRLVTTARRLFPSLQLNSGKLSPEAYATYLQQVTITRTGLGIGMILAVLALLLTCVELRWASERSISALSAIGARARVLRIANAVQFLTPMATSGLLAAVIAILAGWGIASFWGSKDMFQLSVLQAVGALWLGALAVGVVVGFATGGGRFSRTAQTDA